MMQDLNNNNDDTQYNYVEQVITDLIMKSGSITFEEFMDKALYYPKLGYYTSSRQPFGDQGDFHTSLDKGNAFTSTLSNCFFEMWDIMDRPTDFTIVDVGAGRGGLVRGVLRSIERKFPDLFNVVSAFGIDKGFVERADGDRGDDFDGRLKWQNSLEGIGHLKHGVIISNELFDALPVHRVTNQNGELKEIFTTLSGHDFVDQVGDLSKSDIKDYFEKEKITIRPGQKAEVCLKAGFVISSFASMIEKGFVITIDYGYPGKDLYNNFPNGTLHCHYKHQVNDKPYQNVGTQDITAHINFSNLMRQGDMSGLTTEGFTKQSNFLIGLGIQEDFRELQKLSSENIDDITHNQGLKELIMPGGMGDTFKVMVQSKGFGRNSGLNLKGFSMRNFIDRL